MPPLTSRTPPGRALSLLHVVVCGLLFGLVIAPPASATTFVVNSPGDDIGLDVGNGICEIAPGSGVCTLRRALAEANRLFRDDAPVDAEGQPAVTIVLAVPGGVIDVTPGMPLPAVIRRGDLTIVGSGLASTAIDGHGTDVFSFSHDCGKTVHLAALTVRGAATALEGCGTLQLDHVALTDSMRGLRWAQGNATLTAVDISRNGTPAAGGGVLFIEAGPMIRSALRIRQSALRDNRGQVGAAIHVTIGLVDLDGVTLSGNVATQSGGAIFVSGFALLRTVNSTFSGNAAGASGGAVFVEGRAMITASPEAGAAVLVHTTVTLNRADDDGNGVGSGGGVATAAGPLGSAGRVELNHSIVTENRTMAVAGGVPGDCAGTVHISGATVMGIADCQVTGLTPIISDANLNLLTDNGGPTATHALKDGSDAIDAGDAVCHDATGAPLTVDQRGYRRPAATRCDPGAYEYQATAPARAQPRDLNGDGRSDLIFRNATGGQVAVWFMDGSSSLGGGSLPSVVDPDWDIAASDDFDGDGHADLVWRHLTTGRNAVWLMSGATTRAGLWLPPMEDTSWRIAGTGDFDGDGRADLVWASPDGHVEVWLLAAGVLKRTVALPLAAGWTVVGVGDGNGDHKSDILWRQTATGENALWIMDGTAVVAGQLLPSVAEVGWRVGAWSDLDGDGQSDVLWRNPSTRGISAGQTFGWLLSGGVLTGAAYLPTVDDAAWHLAGVWDTDGDGRGDLIWQSNDHRLARWRMNGLAIQSADVFATLPNGSWQLK